MKKVLQFEILLQLQQTTYPVFRQNHPLKVCWVHFYSQDYGKLLGRFVFFYTLKVFVV